MLKKSKMEVVRIMRNLAILVLIILIAGCSATGKKKESPLKSQEVITYTVEMGIDELTNDIIASMEKGNKKSIAIVNFTNIDDSKTKLERYISEELTTKMFMKGKFNIIERNLMEKVMEENQLSISGIMDENTAKMLGKILGVDAICTGSITDFGTTIKINSRLISTETGLIYSAASIKIIKDDDLVNLMKPVGTSNAEKSAVRTKKETKNVGTVETGSKKNGNVTVDISSGAPAVSFNDSLIAYWSFDDEGRDASGNKNDLAVDKIFSRNNYKDGMKGKSYEFTTSWNDWFSIPSWKITNKMEKQITISAWIKSSIRYMLENDAVILSGAHPLNNGFVLLAKKQNAGFIWRPVIEGKPYSYGEIEADSDYRAWTHVAVTYDGEYSRIYLNGKLEKELKAQGKLKLVDNSQIAIGANYGIDIKQQFKDGCLDEMKIFRKALSAEEVKALFYEAQ